STTRVRAGAGGSLVCSSFSARRRCAARPSGRTGGSWGRELNPRPNVGSGRLVGSPACSSSSVMSVVSLRRSVDSARPDQPVLEVTGVASADWQHLVLVAEHHLVPA